MLHTIRLWIVALAAAGVLAGVAGCEKPQVPSGSGAAGLGAAPVLPLPPKALVPLGQLQPPVVKPVNTAEVRPMSPQAAEALAEAEKALSAGDLTKAVERLGRARDFEPANPKVRRSLAMAYASQGDLGKALENLRAALKAAPDDLESQVMLGKLMSAQKRDDESALAFRTALRTSQASPENRLAAEALLRLASILQEQGYWTAALDAYNQLGAWVEKHGRNYTSPQALRELALRPERMQTMRGQLLMQLRRPAEAVEPLRKSFDTNRTDLATARLLLEALIATKQYPRAEKLLVELAGETTQAAQLSMLAEQLCRYAKDSGMPLRIWRSFRKKNSISPLLAVSLANISERLGKADDASAILGSVIQAMPGNVPASNALAGLLARHNSQHQALETLADVARRNPEQAMEIAEGVRQVAAAMKPDATPAGSNPSMDYAQMFVAALLAQAKGQSDAAMKALAAATAEKKGFLPAYEAQVDVSLAAERFADADAAARALPEKGYFADYLAGKILMAQNKPAEAIKLLEAARKANGKFVPNLRLLAEAYLRQHQQESAVNALFGAIEANPDETRAYRRLFEIYVQSREYDSAQRMIGRLLERQPQNLAGLIMLAELNLAIHQRPTAANILQQMLEQAPENVEANVLAARAELTSAPGMVSKAQFDRALKFVDTALKGDPRNAAVLRLKAELLAQPGHFDQVAAVWKQLYEQSPREEYARGYAGALMLAHQYKQAVAVLMPVAGKTREASLRQALIEALVEDGQGEQAAGLLLGWIRQAASAPATAPKPADAAQERMGLQWCRARLMKLYEDALDKKAPIPALTVDTVLKVIDDWRASADPDTKAALAREKVRLYCRAGQYDQAAEAAEAVTGEPHKPLARQTLVLGLIEAKQFDRAVALLDKWIAAGGADTDNLDRLRTLKLTALAEGGKYDAAEQFAHEWIKQSPESAPPRRILVLALMEHKQYDRALKALGPWLGDLAKLASIQSGQDEDGAPVTLADVLRRLHVSLLMAKEKHAEALKAAEQYLQKSPADKNLLNLKSAALTELGRHDESLTVMEKVLSMKPDDAGANNNLGYFYAERGKNLEKAEKMLRKALNDRPGEPSFMDSLGWILYRQGRFHEAASPLREVVFSDEADAQHPVIFDHAGDAFWRLGWTAEAAAFWAKAVELTKKERQMTGEIRQVAVRAAAKLKAYQQHKAPEIAPVAPPEAPAGAAASVPASKPASGPATMKAK